MVFYKYSRFLGELDLNKLSFSIITTSVSASLIYILRSFLDLHCGQSVRDILTHLPLHLLPSHVRVAMTSHLPRSGHMSALICFTYNPPAPSPLTTRNILQRINFRFFSPLTFPLAITSVLRIRYKRSFMQFFHCRHTLNIFIY